MHGYSNYLFMVHLKDNSEKLPPKKFEDLMMVDCDHVRIQVTEIYFLHFERNHRAGTCRQMVIDCYIAWCDRQLAVIP